MKKNFFLKSKKSLEAFGLMEIALSLIIIGLLMGFALKGTSLYESAKLQSLMDQVEQIRFSHFTFQEQFSSLPGDFSQASQALDDEAKNGNGDGFIDGNGLEEGSEAYEYWQHLFYAGLLARPDSQKLPSSRWGGVFVLEIDQSDRGGIWYALKTPEGKGVLTPRQAYSLNKKFDNGSPLSGRIRSESGQTEGDKKCCLGEVYDLAETSPTCIMYFQL